MFNMDMFSKLGDMIPKLEEYSKHVVATVQRIFEGQNGLHEKIDRLEAKIDALTAKE